MGVMTDYQGCDSKPAAACPAVIEPPAFIDEDNLPKGFDTRWPINMASYRGYRYHWNSPCASTGQKAGWSIGRKI